ncbi:unnamed protein product [Lactuca saligna]|uniref:Bifunctional inhibitor/plant lipid transfer protein/seed storage helical domain-containing protein n=1 Tax=Lactuca saligna TaxID=75948 RepID=A0AA36A302_LACSI|nr:unnamed protein product [Lactuca saligna]
MPCKPTDSLYKATSYSLSIITTSRKKIKETTNTMAKLAILALAFTAIVAFAEVSAYTTTTITTIMEDVPSRSQSQSQGQCRRRIQGQQVSHCQMHITEGSSSEGDLISMPVVRPKQQEPHLQLCCQQLRNVEEECQCEAINEAFEEAQKKQQQQQQQGGRRGGQGQQGRGQLVQQMLRRAEQIPDQCNLQIQQCRIQQGRWF